MQAMSNHRQLASMASLLFSSMLAGCGGGGYGGGGGGMTSCGGAYGGSCTPTVAVTNTSGAVSGTVPLAATASAKGSYTVTSVQFRVDGTAVGAADTTAPYSYDWDSTTVADGAHQITAVVSDSASQTATSTAVTLTVSNNGTFAVTLAASQIFPQPVTAATGTGSIAVNSASGAASGSITLAGLTPTSVEMGDAYAGALSAVVITLTQNGTNANVWDVPAAAALNAQQRADLAAGKIYVVVRTAAYPNGELKAQLLPAGIVIKFAALTGSAEVPPVVSAATGQVAVTVDAALLHAAAHINVAGLAATGAELATGAAGAAGTNLATLAVDAGDPNHYFNDAIVLTSIDATNFTSGLWYGNVFTAAHAAGELRGQLATPAPAPTLTQLQADIFTPICSVCHTGVGAGLPGVQNLTAGNTYATLVNVASIEQAAVLRIKPGDPDNSYLVRKIQGTPGISGAQMPLTGGPLTQAQIDAVRSWVAAGALNN